MGSSIVLKSLSILLGLFFVFVGLIKISSVLSKDLHKDLVSIFCALFIYTNKQYKCYTMTMIYILACWLSACLGQSRNIFVMCLEINY